MPTGPRTPSTSENPERSGVLLREHREAAESPVEKAARVLDHLVDALAGEPSSPLRRAQVLIDIALNPGTSQAAILDRVDSDKSSLARDIDWLYNYGCITRSVSELSGRESALNICGFAKNHLGFAAKVMNGGLESLQNLLSGYISFFQGYRPTLREAKMVTVMAGQGEMTRPELFSELYNGPATTDTRALTTLIEQGFLSTDDGTDEE